MKLQYWRAFQGKNARERPPILDFSRIVLGGDQPDMRLPASLRALNHQNFRRYYVGQTVSQLGSWIQSTAIMWLAYRLTEIGVQESLLDEMAMKAAELSRSVHANAAAVTKSP